MRLRLTGLSGLGVMVSICFATALHASELSVAPNAADIEKLFREWMKTDRYQAPGLQTYENASLVEFRLLDLERITASRWHAGIDALVDFGPSPPSIVGFERVRKGQYRVLIKRDGRELEVLRVTPVSRAHPLPASD